MTIEKTAAWTEFSAQIPFYMLGHHGKISANLFWQEKFALKIEIG